MQFKTGDILVYTSVNCADILSRTTIGLDPGHSIVILVGKEYGIKSSKGLSPSGIYVTAFPEKIWPLEFFLYIYWHKSYYNELVWIHRKTGNDISPQEGLKIWDRVLSFGCSHFSYIGYNRKVLAYFKLNYLHPDGVINSCSEFSCSLLREMGYVSEDAITKNILPADIYNLTFYQTVTYFRIPIFNKGLNENNWLRSIPFITLGWIEPEPLKCEFIEKILEKYQPPEKCPELRRL